MAYGNASFDRQSYASGYRKGEKDASVQQLERIAIALEQITEQLKKGQKDGRRNRDLLRRLRA